MIEAGWGFSRCQSAHSGYSTGSVSTPSRRSWIQTSGQRLYEFTDETVEFVRKASVETGLLTVFVRHTSASLLVQENADPDVRVDIEAFFARLVPPASDPAMSYITHRNEGSDDMAAHIKSVLTQTSLSIPIAGGKMVLGTWQGLYLFEHRDRSHRREVVLHISD